MIARMHRIRLEVWAVLVAALVVLGVAASSQPTFGSLQATVTNSANTAASDRYFTCNSWLTSSQALWAFDYAQPAGAQPSNLAAPTGPKGSNQITNNGIAFQSAPSPCAGEGSVADITNPAASTSLTRSSFFNGPSSLPVGALAGAFSQEVWFRTTAGYGRGGVIMSFGDRDTVASTSNVANEVSTNKDHQFFMREDGKVTFNFWNATATQLTSPTALNDGAWHQVVATLSPQNGIVLFVDGVAVATSRATPSSAGANAQGSAYLHVGYDNLDGWAGASHSWGFTGAITNLAVWQRVITPDEVAAHWRARL